MSRPNWRTTQPLLYLVMLRLERSKFCAKLRMRKIDFSSCFVGCLVRQEAHERFFSVSPVHRDSAPAFADDDRLTDAVEVSVISYSKDSNGKPGLDIESELLSRNHQSIGNVLQRCSTKRTDVLGSCQKQRGFLLRRSKRASTS